MRAYQLTGEARRVGLKIKYEDDGTMVVSNAAGNEVRVSRRGIASHDGYTISIDYAERLLFGTGVVQ